MNTSISIYPSKVDWWIAGILIGIPLFAIGLGIHLMIIQGWIGLFPIFMGVFIATLIYFLSIPCRYTITDRFLIIQNGLNKDQIELHRIQDAILSSNPLSAPALSLQRVKVILDKGFLLISPINRESFIDELKQKTKTG